MLGENLKILRKVKGYSQEDMSLKLGIPRSSYSGYENEVAEPSVEMLLRMADCFGITVDNLIRTDLSKLSEDKLKELDTSGARLKGEDLRVLVITTDAENEDMIELVSETAKAGYAAGYADPEFIKVLPAFNLPFLNKQKKCRAFPISGDSMPPVSHGSFVIGEYLENWHMIRDGFPYIIITKNEGIVFKMVYNHLDESQSLQLCSTNILYKPYEIQVSEILEVWKFVNYICSEIEESKPDEADLGKSIRDLQREVAELKAALQS
jgi:transcriptional regulator with XRE-family HTH domain